MRFPIVAALLYLPFCLAATKEAVHQKLVDLAAANNGNIKLDEKSFDLLTAPKRNWSASIQLTALDKRRRCTPCREFEPSFITVAKAWSTVPAAERDNHFFATLDFDDSNAVFQRLGLASAPVVFIYPPTEGPRQPANGRTSPLKYDFSQGFDAEPLATSLSAHTPVPIPYRAPIDWARYGTFAFAAVVLALTIRYTAPIFQNRWVWAAGTVLTSLIMTSGYMFTRIRGMPYTGAGGQWIAAGYQSQFGQETQVVAGIYGILAVSFLMLTVVTPYQSSQSRQRTQIYLWTTVILIIFSILVSLFRVKNRGYPFKLFL
ncbi:hypothetical protein PLICRDRAFT_54324 [Plicaturopsis crispa FD-325 SS-3]|nr:hypothetical protein PLICRDRAFT_54324 [Plicaturopsis crispa FD-325 SS-3]